MTVTLQENGTLSTNDFIGKRPLAVLDVRLDASCDELVRE
jgi:hypothetical protein